MVDVWVMTSVNKYTPVQTRSVQTMSFGSHRQTDRPASAVRAGASTMPAAWQTRGVQSFDTTSQHGAPARTFVEIALDPFKWAMSTKLHRIATFAVVGTVLVTLIF